MEESLMYTAVVLYNDSRKNLLSAVRSHMGEKLTHPEIIAHHATLNMGPLSNGENPNACLGQSVELTVHGIAYDKKVVAVKVSTPDLKTKNKVMHITIAVNRADGGKPFLSNKLDWNKTEHLVINGCLYGEIMECS